MIKKERKIAVQLFTITFMIITVLIGALLIVQSVFFERFYTAWKTNKLQSELDEYARIVSGKDLSYTEWLQLNNNFSLQNNASIRVTDEKGNNIGHRLRENQEWYHIIIEYKNGEQKRIVLSEYEILMHLQGKGIKVDNDYYIMADNIDNQYQSVFGLIDNDRFGFNNGGMININDSEKIMMWNRIKVRGISGATKNEIGKYGLFGENNIIYADSDVIFESAVLPSNIVFPQNILSYGIDIGSVKYDSRPELIEMKKTVTNDNGEKLSFNLVASLQPVDEASAAITSYYPWFFLTAVITALIVAFVYSRRVSKPITNISKAANEMAKGKLDTRLSSKHKNEIGVLSESLNLLSANLQNSLNELKDANKKLLEDIAEKEHQEQIRREFTANVSHDLKTPLGVMRCYVELLQDNIEPEKKDEYFDTILAEINKMNKMVMQMLELAKAESGDITLDESVFSIEDMISDVVTLFKPMFDEKHISVNKKGNFTKINADMLRMEQVMTNLVGNAVNYVPYGTSIDVIGVKKDGKCKISVVNKCNSITQEQANQLFKRFYMLDKSRNQNGTGLGLAICAAIFELHGFEYGAISHGNSIEFWFEYTI